MYGKNNTFTVNMFTSALAILNNSMTPVQAVGGLFSTFLFEQFELEGEVSRLTRELSVDRGSPHVGVTPGPSHWKSRSMWSCYSLSGLMYSISLTVVILSLAKVHECMQKFIC